jgi:hypothetical protein
MWTEVVAALGGKVLNKDFLEIQPNHMLCKAGS